jgi:hypothetical protein
MKNLDSLEYDTIVLGGTLEAFIHSYVEGIPLIMVNPQMPFYRDIDPLGSNKAKTWSRLCYYLSLAGLNPIGDKAGNYRFEEDNILTVFGKTASKVSIEYKNIIRYDQIKPTEKLRVLDYIKMENVQKEEIPNIDKIKTGDSFIDSFYTLIENRISDIAAISFLTQEQLDSEEYSEIYARIKATEVLKQNGIVGRLELLKNGWKRTHRVKTKTIRREIYFDTREQEDNLLLQRKETKSPEMKKITEMLGSPYDD